MVAAGVLMEMTGNGKQYSSRVMASIRETAEGLHKVGLMDKQIMREFDGACLTRSPPILLARRDAARNDSCA